MGDILTLVAYQQWRALLAPSTVSPPGTPPPVPSSFPQPPINPSLESEHE